MASQMALLVVDGYNVMGATRRYQALIDEKTDAAHLDTDPFVRAREMLISDVATFAQGSYEAVVVFDGANNLSESRADLSIAGVRVVYSRHGESADTAIERIVTQARRSGRKVALVTSDNTIRATVGGPGVARLSSALLVQEMERDDVQVEQARVERTHAHMTLEDRLSPEQRKRLWKMLGH